MTLEGVFPDLLAPLPSVAGVEAELARSLRRLVAHARAVAGALGFTPPGDAPVVVTAGGGGPPPRAPPGGGGPGGAPPAGRAPPRGAPPPAAPGPPVPARTPRPPARARAGAP